MEKNRAQKDLTAQPAAVARESDCDPEPPFTIMDLLPPGEDRP